jgi:hypothetical protein
MIIETKEQLVKQLTEAWEIIRRCDEALEHAAHTIASTHKNLRQYVRQVNSDQGAVRGEAGVDSTSGVGAGSEAQTGNVHRVSARKGEYVLRPRRDTSSG